MLKVFLWVLISTISVIISSECLASDVYFHNKKGLSAIENGQYENAISAFSKAISKNPHSGEIYYNLGQAYYLNKQFKEASGSFNAAKRTLQPHLHPFLQYNLGNASFRSDDLKKAKELYENALLKSPYDEDTKFNLEVVLKKMEEDSEDEGEDNENDNNSGGNGDSPQGQQPPPQANNNENENENDDQNDDGESKDQPRDPESDIREQTVRTMLNRLDDKEQDAREKYVNAQMPPEEEVEKDW